MLNKTSWYPIRSHHHKRNESCVCSRREALWKQLRFLRWSMQSIEVDKELSSVLDLRAKGKNNVR
jgi:hypothetical protein